jgi:hypothetical protein
MARGAHVAAAGLALAASLVLLQGSLAQASPGTADGENDGGGDTVVQFDVRFSPFDYTDLGEPGPSPADLIVFHDVLSQHGTEVGHEVGSCVVVDAEGLASCTAVITLDEGGTIAFSLENAPPPRKVLAVTGGSDRYRAVRGDGVLVETGDGTGTLTLHLELDGD